MKKIRSGAVILTVTLLLVFFSKTIYTWNLPHVTAVKPFRGTLTKFTQTQGAARWADVENIYAPLSGTVASVLVAEGDAVRAGQPLWTMDYGVEETERRLAETVNNIAKAELEIENGAAKLREIDAALDGAAGEGVAGAAGDGAAAMTPAGPATATAAAAPAVAATVPVTATTAATAAATPAAAATAAMALPLTDTTNLAAIDIAQAERDLRNAETLFALGYASRNDRDAARKNYQTVLTTYARQRDELRLTLRSRELDLANLRLTEAACRDALADYAANAVVAAPASGVVQTLNIEKGQAVQENALLAVIGRRDAGGGNGADDTVTFVVDCPVPLESTFIARGDRCALTNGAANFSGVVTKIQTGTQSKTVSVTVSAPAASLGAVPGAAVDVTGDIFDVTFEKTGAGVYTLVPSGVVYGGGSDAWVFQVKRRDGVMGKEYYVEKLNVYVGDADWQNTAIARGITFFEPLAASSSAPLTSGQTVLLDNPEDFFEN